MISPDIEYDDAQEGAGEVGRELAEMLAVKVKQAIDGFPASEHQRECIGALLRYKLAGEE